MSLAGAVLFGMFVGGAIGVVGTAAFSQRKFGQLDKANQKALKAAEENQINTEIINAIAEGNLGVEDLKEIGLDGLAKIRSTGNLKALLPNKAEENQKALEEIPKIVDAFFGKKIANVFKTKKLNVPSNYTETTNVDLQEKKHFLDALEEKEMTFFDKNFKKNPIRRPINFIYQMGDGDECWADPRDLFYNKNDVLLISTRSIISPTETKKHTCRIRCIRTRHYKYKKPFRKHLRHQLLIKKDTHIGNFRQDHTFYFDEVVVV